jgi:hypothetical protein
VIFHLLAHNSQSRAPDPYLGHLITERLEVEQDVLARLDQEIRVGMAINDRIASAFDHLNPARLPERVVKLRRSESPHRSRLGRDVHHDSSGGFLRRR